MSDEEIREKAEEKDMHLELLSGYFHAPEQGHPDQLLLIMPCIELTRSIRRFPLLRKSLRLTLKKKRLNWFCSFFAGSDIMK